MKTDKLIFGAAGIVVVIAVSVFCWQQRRWTRAQAEIQRLRSETAQLAALKQENARLKRLEADQAELARLRQTQTAAQLEVARLRGQAAGAHRAEAEATRLRSELERQTNQGPGGTNAIAAPMAEMMKGVMEQQFLGRLTRMQEKLNLTPDQAQAIRDILTRQAKHASEAMQGVFSGKLDKQQIAKIQKESGDPEAEIRALLSPEQQTAYAALKDEESVSNARLVANAEVLQMQTALGLTSDQQDKVFNVLYDQTLQQLKGEMAGEKPANPAEALQAITNRKLKALEGVLTPAQLEGYRQQQERQLKFVQGILGEMVPEQPAAKP